VRPGRTLAAATALRLAGGCLLAAGCAAAGWHSPLERDHPLAGRIWDVAAARFVGARALETRLAAHRYVLLGEKHDNADHHALQARLLRALVDAGRRPATAFEMLSTDRAAAIARQLAVGPRDPDALAEAGGWQRSWGDFRLYRPIVEVALDAGLPVVAANIPGATARAVTRGDTSTLDPVLRTRYALDRPPPPDVLAAMIRNLRDAHCGLLPERLVDGMVAAQRARDAQMAAALLDADADGAVLIAGAGHVRRDHGVPRYVRLRAPDADVVSVAFVEVRAARTAPAEYAGAWGGALPFDYVWFTPRVDDRDPCEALRRRRPT
jgi:uncharacterized iron-regulated protein